VKIVNSVASIVSRIFFIVSLIMVGLALIERLANLFGLTILRGGYTSGRVLELAALMMIFVIAILLRQIRDSLRKGAA
jgi:hypothetical protein